MILNIIHQLQPLFLPGHVRAAHGGDGAVLCPDGTPPVQGRQDYPPGPLRLFYIQSIVDCQQETIHSESILGTIWFMVTIRCLLLLVSI